MFGGRRRSSVWTTRQRDTDPGSARGSPSPKSSAGWSVFYFYFHDERWGRRSSSSAHTSRIRPRLGERPRVGQAAGAAAGIGFTPLANGFAACDDPAALQEICDRFGPARAGVLRAVDGPAAAPAHRRRPGRRLLVGAVDAAGRVLPHPGLRRPVQARAFFEELMRDNIDLGRPEHVELIFAAASRRARRASRPPAAASRPGIDRTATWSPSTCSTSIPGSSST